MNGFLDWTIRKMYIVERTEKEVKCEKDEARYYNHLLLLKRINMIPSILYGVSVKERERDREELMIMGCRCNNNQQSICMRGCLLNLVFMKMV